MAVTRMNIARSSTLNNILNIKLKIVELLKEDKEEKARIKAEQLMQEEKKELAYDLVETLCELLATRIAYVDSVKVPPPELVGTMHSIIYASERLGVQELLDVRDQLKYKFGNEFVATAKDNKHKEVHFKLVGLLAIEPPMLAEVYMALKRICKEYNLNYDFNKHPDGVPPANFDPMAPSPHPHDHQIFPPQIPPPQVPPPPPPGAYLPPNAGMPMHPPPMYQQPGVSVDPQMGFQSAQIYDQNVVVGVPKNEDLLNALPSVPPHSLDNQNMNFNKQDDDLMRRFNNL
eukprot:GDKK01020373.1.p1 GENE.GDKK01020373.1~~GDKK01020373.1.p1  ORF type:complete len:314 (+),score=89.53 GDKK01020373.1:79-942(+)